MTSHPGRHRPEPDAVLHLRSEFAATSVSVDRTGNGDRLRLHCEPGGLELFLDPLQIEALARLPEPELAEILHHIEVAASDEPGPDQTARGDHT